MFTISVLYNILFNIGYIKHDIVDVAVIALFACFIIKIIFKMSI